MSTSRDQPVHIDREIQLGRLLGEGGMGEVFEGFEPSLGAHAAVKVLRTEHAEDRETRERFEQESLLMASIEHPGCLPIYGWGTTPDGRPFYAMKQISGQTLAGLLAERGDGVKSFIWRRRLLRIFQSVCEVMSSAHEHGIVHRDLKPENIMIDPFGAVYVIDWGIAKRVGGSEPGTSRTLAGSVMGTPGYMAPEQAEGRAAAAGPEADVFALGTILYEILTGQAPFAGQTEREAMAHTVHREPAHPRRLNPFIGRSLSAVCMKALAKDPGRRYRTAEGLAADIAGFNEGRPVAVVRPSPVERAAFWARRDPLRATLTWALVLSILAGLGVVGFQVWLDHRLADKTWETVASLDQDVAELRNEIATLRTRISATPAAERDRLAKELALLEARVLLREVQAFNAVRSVKRLRFLRADPELDREARRRLFTILEDGMEGRHVPLLHAMVNSLLEEIEEGTATIDHPPEDVGRLRTFKERAAKTSGS